MVHSLQAQERTPKTLSEHYARHDVTRAADLPDFDFPPVVEVALGVQFEPLVELGSKHLAILSERWRDEFPIWEDQPPLQTVKEWFGVPGQSSLNFRLDVRALPPLRRAFFFDRNRTELRQVQADRFVRNWRRNADVPYPRYDDEDSEQAPKQGLRSRFRRDMEQFVKFVHEQELGEFVPNQCEVTYVNHIPVSGELGAELLGDLFAPWRGAFSDDFLSPAESVEAAMHFVITDSTGSNVGRLHVEATPVRDQESGNDLTRLTLTARGMPMGTGVEGVLSFLDLGRRYVVKGFASVTTTSMHKKWRRRDGG
jgi:uncharacterized protein (TIGR04255 family)